MTVYLASYKATRPGLNGLINRGIRLLDRAKYSHTEICIGNPLTGVAKCYSSSGEDGGVRMKEMRLSPEKWDVLHLPFVSDTDVTGYFLQTAGEGYDYLGVGRFALPWLLREHPTRHFCSEWAMAVAGVKDAWRYGPQAAHMIGLALGGIEVGTLPAINTDPKKLHKDEEDPHA